jgi:membrane protein implicated in regulation of membrane protease activity
MRFFVQVTAAVAVGIVILIALAFLLKIFVIAAIIAAIVVGVLAVRKLFVRRSSAVRPITYRR